MAIPFGLGVADIVRLAQIVHDLHDKIAAECSLDESKQVPTILDSSGQKLDLWIKTWLGNQAPSQSELTILWGNNGWLDIQNLLNEIKETSLQFQPPDPRQQQHCSSDSKSWWRKLTWTKQEKPVEHTPTSRALDLALELEQKIDQLWAYTEVIFDSLHHFLTREDAKPAICDSDHLVASRRGAVSLYDAAQNTKHLCLLIVGSPGHQKDPSTPTNPENRAGLPECQNYRLLTDAETSRDRTEEWGLENILDITDDLLQLKPVKSDLQTLREAPRGDVIRFKGKSSKTKRSSGSFFKCQQIQVLPAKKVKQKSLNTYFDWNAKESSEFDLSLSARFELAFSLAQSCAWLLGTPWLADLKKEHLSRVSIEGELPEFCWRNDLVPLDDRTKKDPGTLSEASQLFRLGVILMELALGGIEHEDLADMESPLVWASQQLPKVQMVAGSEYSKACEFCIKDHGSVEAFGRPEKLIYAEEIHWNTYLRDLLSDFEREVLSR